MSFEYKVVPAPTRGKKAKGVKTAADRFAHALSELMNEMAAEGWEYQRTDTLPSEERSGLTGRTTVFQNMLVFRRAVDTEAETTQDEVAPAEAQALSNIFVEDSRESHAPKLPGADAAQEADDARPAPLPGAERRDVAAE